MTESPMLHSGVNHPFYVPECLVGPLSCMGLSGPVILLFLHMWCILLGLTLPLLQPSWPQCSTESDGFKKNECVRKNEITCVWKNNTWSSMLPWKAGTTIILGKSGVKWAQMFNCIDFPRGNRIMLWNLHCKEVCPRNGKSISENNELPTSGRIQKAKVLLTQKC